VTQLAYADVKAVSKVSDVTLNNYTGLGSDLTEFLNQAE
jgi:hypothetical protein